MFEGILVSCAAVGTSSPASQNIPNFPCCVLLWFRISLLCASSGRLHITGLYLASGRADCRFVAYQWPWNRILQFSMTSPPNMTAFFPWPVYPWHASSCIFSCCVKLKELWEGKPKRGGEGGGERGEGGEGGLCVFLCGMRPHSRLLHYGSNLLKSWGDDSWHSSPRLHSLTQNVTSF